MYRTVEPSAVKHMTPTTPRCVSSRLKTSSISFGLLSATEVLLVLVGAPPC